MKKHVVALATAGMIAVFAATPAFATNVGTKSGVTGRGCAVEWNASAVLDPALTNDDATYPNLMINYDGKPAPGGVNAYTNGGYITEVRRELGGPGVLEVNHFFLGSSVGVFRIPTATDDAIANATVVVQLPTDVDNVQFDPVSTNATIATWGPAYADYAWAPTTGSVRDLGGNRFEVKLGDLAAKQGTVYQFSFHVPAGTTHPRYVASAELTGTYAPGTRTCTTGTPAGDGEETPTPTPTPTQQPTPQKPSPSTSASSTPVPTASVPAPSAPDTVSAPVTADVAPTAPAMATPSATAPAVAPGLARTGGHA